MSNILLKKEFSSCNCDRPVCRVHQVIDTLTVLRSQHLICTTAETNTKKITKTLSVAHMYLMQITKFTSAQPLSINYVPITCAEQHYILSKTTTYFKTRVSSLIACTATSYSLSRVIETMRS